MGSYVYDTNCLVAALSDRHVHHEPTMADFKGRQQRGDTWYLPVACAVEAYCVLTRDRFLREPPDQAAAVIAALTEQALVLDLDPDERLRELPRAAGQRVQGLRIFDHMIAACALKSGAQVLVTWNLRDFRHWSGSGMEIVNPLGERA